jgi:hypothetical protein
LISYSHFPSRFGIPRLRSSNAALIARSGARSLVGRNRLCSQSQGHHLHHIILLNRLGKDAATCRTDDDQASQGQIHHHPDQGQSAVDHGNTIFIYSETTTEVDPKTRNVQVNAVKTETETSTLDLVTITETKRETSTTVTAPTTTPPMSSGFVPIQSSLPGLTVNGLNVGAPFKRDVSPNPQNLLIARGHERSPLAGSLQAREKLKSKTQAGISDLFPKKVTCQVTTLIPKIVPTMKIGSRTITITAATPVVVSTQTQTITATSTVYPDDVIVETTSTVTVTEITQTLPVTTTTTTTITETETVTAPKQTHYLACAPDNIANYGVDGATSGYISSYSYTAGIITGASEIPGTTPYDCCAYCQSFGSNCKFGFLRTSTNTCRVYTGGSACNPDAPCTGLGVNISPAATEASYVLFNGLYARWSQYFYY